MELNIEFEKNSSVGTIKNLCPSCKKENSLIYLDKKDRSIVESVVHSKFKLVCLVCKWKHVGEAKWRLRTKAP